MGRLEGKVAIITGAGSGFGRAASIRFVKEGAKVIVAEVNEANGKETVELVKKEGGEAIFVKTDVTKSADVENMVKEGVKAFGKIDVLWANAGIQGDVQLDIAHMSEEMFDKYININLKGVWLTIHHAAKELVKTKGSIICTVSAAATIGDLGCSAYGTSKGGVKTLMFTVANELGLHGVRCNGISPYTADTPGLAKVSREFLEMTKSGNPMHKLIQVDEVVNTVVFLASDESTGINGADILIDAGACVQTQPFFLDEFKNDNPY